MKVREIKIKEILHFDADFNLFDNNYSNTKSAKKSIKNTQSIDTTITNDLYPPLPIYNNMLIWGFHILDRAKKLSKETVMCHILENKSVTDLLVIALSLENRAGQYTFGEQERILKFLTTKLPSKEPDSIYASKQDYVPREIVTLITGKADPHWQERITEYTKFPPGLKELLNNNLIDFKTATRIKELPKKIFQIILKKHLSFSERRILLNDFFEIVQRDRIPHNLAIQYFEEIINSPTPLVSLKRKRFPYLSELEDTYTELKRRHLGKKGINITVPQYFEGEKLTITFSVKNRKELNSKIQHLREVETIIDEFFKLLR